MRTEKEQTKKDEQQENKEPWTAKSVAKEVGSWILTIAAAVILAFILNKYVLINAQIPSGSMENTIMEGDRLLGVRLAYTFTEPKRGDIIIFKFPDNEEENYVKRIIGMPGDTIELRDAKVYINGSETPLEEDYLKEEWIMDSNPRFYQVPDDCYFVMGDNRNDSWDSGYWNNTFVSKDKILGKAWFRYYPANTMGILK